MEVLIEGCSFSLLVPAAMVSCSSLTAYRLCNCYYFFLSLTLFFPSTSTSTSLRLRLRSRSILHVYIHVFNSPRLHSRLRLQFTSSCGLRSLLQLFTMMTSTFASSILHVYVHVHVFNSLRSRLHLRSHLR